MNTKDAIIRMAGCWLVAFGLGLAICPVSGRANESLVKPADAAGDRMATWGIVGASPYYVPDGLQSPFRTTGVHLGGDLWVDTGYEASQRGLAGEPDMQFWLMQGRFMLDATATLTNGRVFGQAKAQMLAHVDEIPGNEHIDTDDVWVRFGIWDLFDIQAGRFEAWEVYHKGEGLERDTLEDLGAYGGPDIYEVNYAFYRQDGFGQIAGHVYFAPWVRFELAAVFGNELGFNSYGGRPTLILDAGWLIFKAAAEYRYLKNQEEGKKQWEEKRGLGGGFEVRLDDLAPHVGLRLGGNAGYGIVDRIDAFDKVDEKGSIDTFSAGGFAKLSLWSAVLGLGYNHTLQGDRQLNDQTGRVGHFVHRQAFASVRHPLYFNWLTGKVVFAWADADLEPSFDNARTNEMYSVRLRLYMQF
jgi:hypothetical protein